MLQVTECPDDVRLLSRMAIVGESGVALGGSIECDLILPAVEPNQDISTVYFCVKQDKQQSCYKLIIKVEGITVNQRPQIANSSVTLNDGDVIAVHGYTLLFSNDNTIDEAQSPAPTKTTEERSDFYDTVSGVEFDASNIFADLESELDQVAEQQTQSQEDEFVDYQAYQEADVAIPSSSNTQSVEKKLDKLLEVSQNPWIQQKQLLMMLDGIVDEFIKEFDPDIIEDMVGPPSRWNNKQWLAYKNYYQRKQREGHFKRQFKALLIECMQK